MASKSGFTFRNLFSNIKNKSSHTEKTVEVPVATSVSQTHTIQDRRTAPREHPAKGSKILIIEDSKTVQAVLSKIFREAGFKVFQAFDGQTGVKMAREQRPNLIMMDVVMPGLTGFQATREIRRDSEIGHTPIVIMSGNKQATEQFWATKIGANEYMTKPFSRADLFRVIEQQLSINTEIVRSVQVDTDASGEYIQPDENYDDQNWTDS